MARLDLVELVMEVEGAFGVSIPEEEYRRLRAGSAADLWRLIVQLRTGHAPDGMPSAGDPTWQRLRLWLARTFGVPVDDVTGDLRLGE